jgi:hypothetical protein
MANTITLTINATYSGNGLQTTNIAGPNQTLTVTTNNAPEGVNAFSVPTTAAAIPLGGIGTLRNLFVQNLDATNYITIYTDNTLAVKLAKLLPGATPAGDALWLPIDPSVTAPYWASHTSPCEVNYRAFGT